MTNVQPIELLTTNTNDVTHICKKQNDMYFISYIVYIVHIYCKLKMVTRGCV